MITDLNMVLLEKGDEKYAFIYPDHLAKDAVGELGNCAENPDLSFSWYDAATLTMKIKDMARKAE